MLCGQILGKETHGSDTLLFGLMEFLLFMERY